MRSTEKIEQTQIDQVFEAERNKEPRYPIIERPDAAQIGKTALEGIDDN